MKFYKKEDWFWHPYLQEDGRILGAPYKWVPRVCGGKVVQSFEPIDDIDEIVAFMGEMFDSMPPDGAIIPGVDHAEFRAAVKKRADSVYAFARGATAAEGEAMAKAGRASRSQ